jgi:hypothetical protein
MDQRIRVYDLEGASDGQNFEDVFGKELKRGNANKGPDALGWRQYGVLHRLFETASRIS